MRTIPPFAPDQSLKIISALSDKTRLEILALLFNNPEGLTAADISRLINKKIPSTIYQLEILQNSGLITNEMKVVQSIGRAIKHWILPSGNYQMMMHLDLGYLIRENLLSMDARLKYLDLLLENRGRTLQESDLENFDTNILQSNELKNFKLNTKDITRLQQSRATFLLIDALIQKCRRIIGDGIKTDYFADIIGVGDRLANLLLHQMQTSGEFYIDKQTSLIRRRPMT
ncbi:MAG: helix-turn-helix domain-containing protein [Candidatus Hodarchaeales archaeon]